MSVVLSADTEASTSSFESGSYSDSLPEIPNGLMDKRTTRLVRESSRIANLSLVPKNIIDLGPEIMSAYKIVASLMSATNKNVNQPFLHPVDDKLKENKKYYSIIQNPVCLNKVLSNLADQKYSTISEVVRDLRLILENCYRFYGPSHPNTKKAMTMETVLEQKLALLPRDLKHKTSLELTSPDLVKIDKEKALAGAVKHPQRASIWKEPSSILSCVRKSTAQQEREQRRLNNEEKKAEKEANNLELIEWEESLFKNELTTLKSMWEIPQIGHFLYLTQSALNIPEVSHFELERSFLTPNSSSLLAVIMTSLLSSPQLRTKLDKIPAMPYRIWQARLNMKVQSWYRTYILKNKCLSTVFVITGVEPEFFRIMGNTNPLEKEQFHELPLRKRVYLVKAACDYCLQNHRSIQEIIFDSHLLDQKEYILGKDNEDNTFINFPQFCGQSLRIYKQYVEERPLEIEFTIPEIIEEIKIENEEIKTEVLPEKEEEKEEEEIKAKPTPRRGSRRRRKPVVSPSPKISEEPLPLKEFTFEMIADSVESLRTLADSYRLSGSVVGKIDSVPEKRLYKNLKNLVSELEPWEQKLVQAEKKSRHKLKKEFEMHLKRVEDNIPEVSENFWGSESEEEVEKPVEDSINSSRLQSAESESEILESSLSTSFRQSHYRRCTKRQRIEKFVAQNSSESEEVESEQNSNDSFQVSVSSRGRIRRSKSYGTSYEENKPIKTPSRVLEIKQRGVIDSRRNQNNVNDAQKQYQWETMRQKLLESDPKNYEIKKNNGNPPSGLENLLSSQPGFGSMKLVEASSSSSSDLHNNKTILKYPEQMSTNLNPRPPPTFTPYQPKIVAKKSNAGQKPTIFRQIEKDGARRTVQTSFLRPGVLRTTVSSKPILTGTLTRLDSKSNNSKFFTNQSSSSLNDNKTINKSIPTSLDSNKKVVLMPFTGKGSTPGKTFILKVISSPNKKVIVKSPIESSVKKSELAIIPCSSSVVAPTLAIQQPICSVAVQSPNTLFPSPPVLMEAAPIQNVLYSNNQEIISNHQDVISIGTMQQISQKTLNSAQEQQQQLQLANLTASQTLLNDNGHLQQQMQIDQQQQMQIDQQQQMQIDQQQSVFTHQGLLDHRQVSTTAILSIGSPIITTHCPQQQIRTVLTPCPVQVNPHSLQLIATNSQIISEPTTQNLIVCSTPMFQDANDNGFLKTTNSCEILQPTQGNLYYLTNTGQIVAVSGGANIEGNLMNENM